VSELPERLKLFLDEYELLVRKHKCALTACSCCDGVGPTDQVREEDTYPPEYRDLTDADLDKHMAHLRGTGPYWG
jgi:hypothetical protein